MLKARFKDALRGFFQGLQAVLRTPKKGLFLLHTGLIWAGYLGMFYVGFFCLPGMDQVPFAAILAGFIAGASASCWCRAASAFIPPSWP